MNLLKSIILVAIIISTGPPAIAQADTVVERNELIKDSISIKIDGQIRYHDNNTPIGFATVILKINNQNKGGTYSDYDGRFMLYFDYNIQAFDTLQLKILFIDCCDTSIYITMTELTTFDSGKTYSLGNLEIKMRKCEHEIIRCYGPIYRPTRLFQMIGNTSSFNYKEIAKYNLGRD